MHSTRRMHIVVLLILALLGAGAIYVVLRPEQPAPIIGMVRTTEVVIAPEIGGQLGTMNVRKGDHVRTGDVLAELSAPELSAAVARYMPDRAAELDARLNLLSHSNGFQRAKPAGDSSGDPAAGDHRPGPRDRVGGEDTGDREEQRHAQRQELLAERTPQPGHGQADVPVDLEVVLDDDVPADDQDDADALGRVGPLHASVGHGLEGASRISVVDPRTVTSR